MPKIAKQSLNKNLSAESAESSARILLKALRVSGFLLLILVVFGWIFPEQRLWGVHFFAFLRTELSVLFLCLGIAFLTPFGSGLTEKFSNLLKPFANRSAWLWAVFAFGIFYSFRVAVPLLGDGYFLTTRLGWIGEFQVTRMKVPDNNVDFRLKEPLEMLLHEGLFYAFGSQRPPDLAGPAPRSAPQTKSDRFFWFLKTAESVFALLSALAGAVAVLILILYSRNYLPKESRSLFLLMMCGGSAALFFGYVEDYSWVSLSMIAALLLGLHESAKPNRFPWMTLLCSVLTVCFHYVAIILLPATLFLILRFFLRTKVDTDKLLKILIAIFSVFGIAFYIYKTMWKGWGSVISVLPKPNSDGYSMFTLNHGIDLINLILLVGFIALICVIVVRKKQLASPNNIQYGFLILATGLGCIFACVFSPNLGAARDWDVMSVGLWPLLVFGAWTISQIKWNALRYSVISILLGVVFLTTVPFVLVNASEKASLDRFVKLLELNPARSGYGWESLNLYYESQQDQEGQIRILRRAVENDANPRYKVNLAGMLAEADRLEEAADILLVAIRQDHRHIDKLKKIAAGLRAKGNYEKARELLKVDVEIAPQDTMARLLLKDIEKTIAAQNENAISPR